MVIGPAGSAGTYSAPPLKITVTRDSDKQQVFSQTYRVEAATDTDMTGSPSRRNRSGSPVPLTTFQLADLYSISVDFEGGTGGPSPTHHKQKKKPTSG